MRDMLRADIEDDLLWLAGEGERRAARLAREAAERAACDAAEHDARQATGGIVRRWLEPFGMGAGDSDTRRPMVARCTACQEPTTAAVWCHGDPFCESCYEGCPTDPQCADCENDR